MKKPTTQRIFTEYQFDEFQTVYVDVDGCLLFWQGIKPGRVSRPGEIGFGVPPTTNYRLAHALKVWRHGHEDRRLIIWTNGGEKHARYAAELCGLLATADYFLHKPQCFVDDSLGWIGRRPLLRVKNS